MLYGLWLEFARLTSEAFGYTAPEILEPLSHRAFYSDTWTQTARLFADRHAKSCHNMRESKEKVAELFCVLTVTSRGRDRTKLTFRIAPSPNPCVYG